MDLELHPWNRAFSWTDHRGPFRLLTAEQVRDFDELGFIVIDGLLEGPTRERTLEEIDHLEATSREALLSQPDHRAFIAEAGAITFSVHLVRRSSWLRQLSATEALVDICHDLIGPDARLYWDQAVYKAPEKPRRFPWHQDNGYKFVDPQQYLTCWVALTDATPDNGCPWVAPGLHRLGTLRHEYVDPLGFECFRDWPEAVAAPVKAGGAVVFSSLTPHLTGPNTTGTVRKAYILQYAPEGARALVGVPPQPPTAREACDAPDRQYPVLAGGRGVPPPPLPLTRP